MSFWQAQCCSVQSWELCWTYCISFETDIATSRASSSCVEQTATLSFLPRKGEVAATLGQESGEIGIPWLHRTDRSSRRPSEEGLQKDVGKWDDKRLLVGAGKW